MGMFDMMKQAVQMRGEMKKIQKALAGQTVEFSSGAIKVVCKCDMSLDRITIDPAQVEPGKVDKLERQLVSAINGALSAAKEKAAGEMQKLTGGLGLDGLMGG